MRDNRRPRYKEIDINWVHETIQTRLKDDQMNPCQLYSYIEQVIYTVCNYINRPYVPEPLKFVVLNIALIFLFKLHIYLNLSRVPSVEALSMKTIS